MRRYTVVLFPEPDGGYTVRVPALPGCVTAGDSIDEGLEMAKDAISLWIEELEVRGEPIPVEPASPEIAAVEVG